MLLNILFVPILAKSALLALGVSVMRTSIMCLVLLVCALAGCVVDQTPLAPVSSVSQEHDFGTLVIADFAVAPLSATPVDVPIDCTSSCDDNKACTVDTCDMKTGECVNTSKGWDCWPCATDTDCQLGMVTCQDDDLIHEDGYSVCLPDKTCETFHKATACPDDGNPCTKEACTTEDDFVFCESKPIVGCKP